MTAYFESREFKRHFHISMFILMGISALVCIGMVISTRPGRDYQPGATAGLSLGFLFLLAYLAYYVLRRGASWLKIWAGIGLVAISFCMVAMPINAWLNANWMFSSYSGPPLEFNPDYLYRLKMDGMAWTFFLATCWMVLVPVALTPRIKTGVILQGLTVLSMTVALYGMVSVMWGYEEYLNMKTTTLGSLILSSAGLAGVFLISRILAAKLSDVPHSGPEFIWLRCPRCRKEQEVSSGPSRCSGCNVLFKIEIEEPRCRKCGYTLLGLTRPVCPECGNNLLLDSI